jgi:tRNA(His) 5'-end guanylyltransferase
MKNDEFGNRMKLYEGAEAGRKLMPLLPAVARLDGRAFHTFTRGLERPYDLRMSTLMSETTKYLVQETNACVGYTQSDEITLVWYSDDIKSQIFFDGRIQKMNSILAAMATAEFQRLLPEHLPDKVGAKPMFDCRVWNVPNKVEGANTVLWREQDATRNSILMSAHHHIGHKKAQDKNTKVLQDMLHEKGINWNDYPAFFKRGVFYQRQRVVRPFTADELEKLPEKHEARKNPDLEIERWQVRTIDMPPFVKVSNRVEVIFDGADPQVESDGIDWKEAENAQG